MTVMKKSNKEDAVSPVIGVMLMLVVTIVIAAVVAAFAGGLATDTESAPVAVLDADVHAGEAKKTGDEKIVIRSLSGDSINLRETSVKLLTLDGDLIAEEKGIGTEYLTPGMTKTVTISSNEFKAGDYVEVSVVVDGKHIVLTKEVLVKA